VNVNEPTNAGRAEAAPVEREARKAANALRERDPRHSFKGEAAKDDQSAALEVLKSAGVSLDHPDLGVIVDAYRGSAQFWELQRVGRRRELVAAQAVIQAFHGEDATTAMGDELLLAAKAVVAAAEPLVAKPGRPVDLGIDLALQFARSRHWDWKVCAASVFLLGATRLQYKFIKKSFGDRHRRNKSRA
jgi:hypothetical protein